MTALGSVFEQLLATLDRLEIPYFIGGSVASGSYGFPRQTNDIDVVADFRNVGIAQFCAPLIGEFYVDPESVLEAVKAGRPSMRFT